MSVREACVRETVSRVLAICLLHVNNPFLGTMFIDICAHARWGKLYVDSFSLVHNLMLVKICVGR